MPLPVPPKWFVRLLNNRRAAIGVVAAATVLAITAGGLRVILNPATAWDTVSQTVTWFCLGGSWAWLIATRTLDRMRREFQAIMNGPPPDVWREIIRSVFRKMQDDGEIPPDVTINIVDDKPTRLH